MAVIDVIREGVARGEYEFAVPHFFEEMADDELIFADIEHAVRRGSIRRALTGDTRGTRYEVIGPATDGREIAIICRLKSTGKLLFITTYVPEKSG